MIEELEDVILTCDLPEHGFAKGDIGTVVLVHQQGKGYEVEFTTLRRNDSNCDLVGESGSSEQAARNCACPRSGGESVALSNRNFRPARCGADRLWI
jgi:hypothetical protein